MKGVKKVDYLRDISGGGGRLPASAMQVDFSQQKKNIQTAEFILFRPLRGRFSFPIQSLTARN